MYYYYCHFFLRLFRQNSFSKFIHDTSPIFFAVLAKSSSLSKAQYLFNIAFYSLVVFSMMENIPFCILHTFLMHSPNILKQFYFFFCAKFQLTRRGASCEARSINWHVPFCVLVTSKCDSSVVTCFLPAGSLSSNSEYNGKFRRLILGFVIHSLIAPNTEYL